MQFSSRHVGTKLAFTITELLVVIVVIALIASLILPGLARAKSLAQSIKCKSNLRQLALAEKLYVDDNEGLFSGADARSARYRDWWYSLGPYIKLDFSSHVVPGSGWRFLKGVFQCPSDPFYQTMFRTTATSYGYNVWGTTSNLYHSASFGLGAYGMPFKDYYTDIKIGGFPSQTPESAVKKASEMMMFADGYVMSGKHRTLIPESWLDRSQGVFGMQVDQRAVRRHHSNRINIVFCDGHVEVAPINVIFFGNESSAAMRWWNLDNEAH